MKVIKHGSTYSQATCQECGCIFGYSEVDLYRDYHYGDDIYTRFTQVRCPECNSINIISENENNKEGDSV